MSCSDVWSRSTRPMLPLLAREIALRCDEPNVVLRFFVDHTADRIFRIPVRGRMLTVDAPRLCLLDVGHRPRLLCLSSTSCRSLQQNSTIVSLCAVCQGRSHFPPLASRVQEERDVCHRGRVRGSRDSIEHTARASGDVVVCHLTVLVVRAIRWDRVCHHPHVACHQDQLLHDMLLVGCCTSVGTGATSPALPAICVARTSVGRKKQSHLADQLKPLRIPLGLSVEMCSPLF